MDIIGSPDGITNGRRNAELPKRWVDVRGDGSEWAEVFIATPSARGAVALSSPPANLTASTDTPYAFAEEVSRILIQNNSGTALTMDFDTAATPGSILVPANSPPIGLDIACTVVHFYSTAATAVNGSVAGNIVLKGWLL